MINKSGKFYSETLKSLGLSGKSAAIATKNASNIIQKVVEAYNEDIGDGHVGKDGKGIPPTFRKRTPGPNGLIYGRIQSGKTRAMITTAP